MIDNRHLVAEVRFLCPLGICSGGQPEVPQIFERCAWFAFLLNSDGGPTVARNQGDRRACIPEKIMIALCQCSLKTNHGLMLKEGIICVRNQCSRC